MENFIAEQLNDNFVVSVFGVPYSTFNLSLDSSSAIVINQFGQMTTLVKVLGIKTSGVCINFDTPKFILLPGSGEPPKGCNFDDVELVKMWKVSSDFSSLYLQLTPISILELQSAETDKSVEIGLRLRDANYSGGIFTGNITASLVVYGINVPIPAIRVRATVGIGGSATVYSQTFDIGGGATATVKVKLKLRAANRACALLEVNGRYGPFSIGDDKEVCVTF